MGRFRILTVAIDFMDGETETLTQVGGAEPGTRVQDGVLVIHYSAGEFGERRHLGSYPLANIRRWKVAEK